MPDLEQDAAIAWLATALPARPDEWPPAVRPAELTGDAPLLLDKLGAALDAMDDAAESLFRRRLGEPPLAELVRDVLAQLGAARQLRLLHWIGDPQKADSQTIVAGLVGGDTRPAEAIRAAIRSCTRRGMLDRMFAPDRLAALHDATRPDPQETA